MMRRPAIVLGTRPEAIKFAPLLEVMQAAPDFDPLVVATAQHREPLDRAFAELGIVADIDLDLFRVGHGLAESTARALAAVDGALDELAPDSVMVLGGSSTAVAGAMAGFYRSCPVIHLEAGQRTPGIDRPFPEEANRRIVSQLATLHLAATPANAARLQFEGVDPDRIYVTGNTVIDSLRVIGDGTVADPKLSRLIGTGIPVVTVTAHRRESWGAPLAEVARAVRDLVDSFDIHVVWPLHGNPEIRDVVVPVLAHCRRVMLTEILSRADFLRLVARSSLVLTDSGGVQEEAPALGCPLVVLRDVTERREGVELGAATLVGTDRGAIVATATALLERPPARNAIVSPYGDGHAAMRCLGAIRHAGGTSPPPEPFVPARTDASVA